MLDYLQILDNPLQDIPLAGALRTMPESFTLRNWQESRYWEKEARKALPLYEALLLSEQQEDSIGEKAHRFLETYRRLRSKVPYTPMHELIWDFFRRNRISSLSAGFCVKGEQKKANLLMLAEKARDYESTSYRGLFNFIRYIENLKKYQVDFGEANVLSDKENTVRIMSIHGSKGLEFPIVFVAGMGKSMNIPGRQGKALCCTRIWGLTPCMDKTFRIRTKTILQKAVQQEIASESLGEELRILYVALTRAKERKLILTGTVSSAEGTAYWI